MQAIVYRECNVVALVLREYIFAKRSDRIADSYREPLEVERSRFRKIPRVTCDSPPIYLGNEIWQRKLPIGREEIYRLAVGRKRSESSN